MVGSEKLPCLQFCLVATRGHTGTTFSTADFPSDFISVPSGSPGVACKLLKKQSSSGLDNLAAQKGWCGSNDPSLRWADGGVAWFKGRRSGAFSFLKE